MTKCKCIIFLITATFLFGCLTPQINNESIERERSLAGQDDQCLLRKDLPPLFTVVENTSSQITVDLGPFISFFKLGGGSYNYKITFRGSKENKEDKEQFVLAGRSSKQLQRVIVPVSKTGIYYFTVFEDENKPFWKQKVFSIAPRERVLTEQEKETLAEQYAPVVSMHDSERFFPVSLEYLVNKVEVDGALDSEPFRLTSKKIEDSFLGGFFSSSPKIDIKFPFRDISKVLPYYGHSESVLKSDMPNKAETALKRRFGENHRTVYYSVFENARYKEIYINYHFFYTYDPKNGTATKDELPAHIFDRESMTVVLRQGTLRPLMVFYGAHLPSQTMGQVSRRGEVLQSWDTGRVFVNWPLVKKINGRVVPAIALGSHGVYPQTGLYAVLLGNIQILKEPAGGNKYLYPETMKDYQKTPTSYSYKLRNLKLESVTSNCRNSNNILAFSGSTVDVLGPVKASFPPYTDREEDYFSYADPNAPMFEMDMDK